MKKINMINVKKMFLDFFLQKKHKILPSSSLIPDSNSGLLFTNAGMNQFKEIFLGLSKKKYSRVVTIQRCVRAGGKNSDLENVGYSNYHHTFFEMLGNFSFGDYSKKEAIEFSWEFLTSRQWLNLNKNNFLVTVYKDDKESYEIWNKTIGFPENRILKIGNNKPYNNSDNFWKMSEIGPCGPCTEIFYNHFNFNTVDFFEKNNSFVEIWNIVFIEFNCDINGKLSKLPMISVDTGMGLERICSVLEGVCSSYQIDFFKTLIHSIAKMICFIDENNNSLKVIADHIRSSVFMISDGVIPSNDGRGYVLRRIIRRAIRHLYLLGYQDCILFKLIKPSIKIMNKFGYVLNIKYKIIEKIILNEENQFFCVLKNGIKLLEKELIKIKNNILPGFIAFKLYDTFGFQFNLIEKICKDRNIKIDKISFDIEMNKQKNRSKKNNLLVQNFSNLLNLNFNTDFLGYKKKKCSSVVLGIFHNEKLVKRLKKKEQGIIILDKTTFYPESGGQIGDSGYLKNKICKFIVKDTKRYNSFIGHIGMLNEGSINLGDIVNSKINFSRRQLISSNHSATHLLHGALRMLFGDCIQQKGSFINEKKFIFDFSYPKKIEQEKISKIEEIVNSEIRKNYFVKEKIVNIKKNKNYDFLISDKKLKNSKFRVLKMNNFSIELCCGTHVKQTGDIGLFLIKKEYSISSGIRRIESMTGKYAIFEMQKNYLNLLSIKNFMKCNLDDIIAKFKKKIDIIKKLKKENNKLKQENIKKECILLIRKIRKVKNINLLLSKLNNFQENDILKITNTLKKKIQSGIFILSILKYKKINLFITICDDLLNKINFNSLIKFIVVQTKGKLKFYSNLFVISDVNINKIDFLLVLIEQWIDKNLI